MKSIHANDDNTIADIVAGGSRRTRALQLIYQNKALRDMVNAFVRNHRGNETDAQDVFHDAMIILDQNVRNGKFRGESPLNGYFYSICRFVWMNRMRKQAHTVLPETMPADEGSEPADAADIRLLDEERQNVMGQLLNTIGERCRKILELWKLSYSMEEIAEQLGFSSSDMARKAKYRCHVALLEQVKNNPKWGEMLR
jgi:RNA polymerase sigma factor (sigma-70 family)